MSAKGRTNVALGEDAPPESEWSSDLSERREHAYRLARELAPSSALSPALSATVMELARYLAGDS